MIRKSLVLGLVLCSTGVGAYALDRDAALIQWLQADAIGYKEMHIYRGSVWGETEAFNTPEWAVVLGVGGGILTASGLSNEAEYMGAIGVKWYANAHSRLSALASYEVAGGDSFRVFSGKLAYEYRKESPSGTFSPFLFASGSIQSVRPSPWEDVSDFTAFLLEVGIGCDMQMSKDFAIFAQASLLDSSKVSGEGFGNYADGWRLTLGMKYFWNSLE